MASARAFEVTSMPPPRSTIRAASPKALIRGSPPAVIPAEASPEGLRGG